MEASSTNPSNGVSSEPINSINSSGFGNPNYRQSSQDGGQEGWTNAFSSWVSAATDAAGKAYHKTQEEGVWDSVTSAVKSGAQWVGEKGKTVVETAKDESFWHNATETVHRSASVFQDKFSGIKSSASVWIDEHFGETLPGEPSQGDKAASYLQTLSSGKMSGFGSDAIPTSTSAATPVLSSMDSRRDAAPKEAESKGTISGGAAAATLSSSGPETRDQPIKPKAFDGLWDEGEEEDEWNPSDFKKATVRKA